MMKAIFLATSCLCGVAFGSQTLTHQQLVEQVVGNTIRFQGPDFEVFEYLGPGGVTLGFSTKTGPFRARWRIIRGSLLCLETDDPMQSGCVTVVLEPGRIEFHRLDGVVEGPFDLLPGNPRKLG